MKRRDTLQVLAAALAAAGFPRAFAQSDRPLVLVVTFPPGGSTDITARIVQPELQKRIGKPVIVENKPGAASQVGTLYVARAAPDGNTLLVCFDTHAINPIAKKNLPYDTFKDFVGVSLAVRFPLVIGASAQVPGRDLREFLAAAKQSPGKFSYASTGVGSLNHLVAEDLKRQSGTDILHVPYGGGGPAVQAVLGNTVSFTLLSYAALKTNIAAGRIKALAVTGTKRLADLPDAPTVAESGSQASRPTRGSASSRPPPHPRQPSRSSPRTCKRPSGIPTSRASSPKPASRWSRATGPRSIATRMSSTIAGTRS
jgi:Uncharacterized protein conserved in bacteria